MSLPSSAQHRGEPAYAELAAATNFSFLRGASHPEEMVVRAHGLGLEALAVTDRNTLAGVVRAHAAAKEAGVRLVVGCRLVFSDETPDILAYPEDRAAYGRLTRLLTTANLRGAKGAPDLRRADLMDWREGLLLAVICPYNMNDSHFTKTLATLSASHRHATWLAASMGYGGIDRLRLEAIAAVGRRFRLPVLATNDVLYHDPGRRPLQDVLTCIRTHQTLEKAGRLLHPNAERHLKPPAEMARLFRDAPRMIAETLNLVARAKFSLNELRYDYPDEPTGESPTAQAELERLTHIGARERYPRGVPPNVQAAIDHELKLIAGLEYAPYFLTVHDIVRFARSRSILCQGRGSAANSAVCFCIGITEVDPKRGDLLFERFISPERREPPDIDVDFEHERREEVIQYIYEKYGRERAGLAATVITYRARSALREVGKVFGLSDDTVGALSGTIWGWSSSTASKTHIRELGLDPDDPTLARVIALTQEIIGFPRHLSQHVGGFVITRSRLDEVIPIGKSAMDGRTIVEWDKDDLDQLGILKIDILALGMLTCLRKAFDMLDTHYGQRMMLSSIPSEDPRVYAMLCRADSLGTFQVESRAQMTMLPRLKPREFYDLVIEVAIVRPGPIQGDMVHPYLRRRQGLEPVVFPKEELREVLGKTLGVPLFQEQAMRIAIVAAGFEPGEADRLRRAMATFRRVGTIGTFQKKMVEGMTARGYERDFAERCFKQIEGFGEYGFPESHAASFALLVYASSWFKCHYPDVFAAALLNSQPMGFYAPAQILRDAGEHGVAVRPVDINHSDWDNTLEPDGPANSALHRRHRDMKNDVFSTHAIRIGLRQIKGIGEDDAQQIMARRGAGFDSVRDLWMRTGLPRATMERLADADVFGSLGLSRRDALWAARGLDNAPLIADGRSSKAGSLPLFASAGARIQNEPDVTLPPMPLGEEVVNDYRFLRLSLKAHPAALIRKTLDSQRILPCADLDITPSGRRVEVAGLVLVR
ncbi:MAG: error-prone DNA polymerase, partial [Pseudomonadota bacterium]